jgi:ABC-2 type transport system permease protein
MLNFAYNSAKYEVKRDKWKKISILKSIIIRHWAQFRMISGVKKSLEYYTSNFSPYQHNQVRIMEYPRTLGSFAQSYANTIPFRKR